jgi:hypothetical protein
MKIIKKGNPQIGWTKRVSCTGSGNGGGGCKAVLEVSVGDLFFTYHHSYDGSSDTYVTFKCAACGVLTDIKVPYSVESIIPKSRRPPKD